MSDGTWRRVLERSHLHKCAYSRIEGID